MQLKDLLKHELIGLEIVVIDADNKSLIGVKGKITDETKNTIKVNNKTLLKKQIIFMCTKNKHKVAIEGKYIVGKPEERIKK